jgi:hypothetical protein
MSPGRLAFDDVTASIKKHPVSGSLPLKGRDGVTAIKLRDLLTVLLLALKYID